MKKKQIIGAIMAATGESVEVLAKKHGYICGPNRPKGWKIKKSRPLDAIRA